MNVRGLRDIPTLVGLASRQVPGSKASALRELARLEQERVRLEHELDMWVANQRRVERGLRALRQRTSFLQHLLLEQPADEAPDAPAGDAPKPGDQRSRTWREIPLGY